MGLSLFLRGLVMGLSIAAPVGPIGVLCIRRTLAEGRLTGFISGLGAASADACYGIITAFGLTFISNFMVSQQTWLRLFGGAFLIFLGVRTFLSKPSEKAARSSGKGLAGAFTSTFLLTLTNPMTILSFAAVFSGLGLAGTRGDYGSAALLVLGVFCGSALWWLLLSGGVSLLRGRFDQRAMQWVNRVSGVVITAFGIYAIMSII